MNNIRMAIELIKIAGKVYGFEFPNHDELDKYLKDHPDADPSSHWVKEPVHTHPHQDIKGPMDQHKKDAIPESPLMQQTDEQKQRKETITQKGHDPELDTGSPWVGKEEKIHAVLQGQAVDLKPIGGAHVNQAYFETHADGSQSVWKPEGGSEYKMEELRRTISPNVSQSAREAVAYDVDQVLGLGIVPPTIYTEKKFIRQDNPDQEQITISGSSQGFVDGQTAAEMDDDISMMYKDGSENFKLSLQKMAMLDEIIGNTDRHTGNIMVSDDKERVYGIDNGLAFPRRLEKDERPESRSVPLLIVNRFAEEPKKPYDERLVRQIAKVKKEDFIKAVNKFGLEEESEEAWNRVEGIKKRYTDILGEEENFQNAVPPDAKTKPKKDGEMAPTKPRKQESA